MRPIDQFNDLKDQVEDLERELARAEGGRDQLLKSMEKEDNCKTTKEGKARIKQLDAEMENLKTEYDQALEEYKRERASGNAARTEQED